mmetsp:Transcript_118195/g.205290  ORF Transcript_118195/g.205290 Transcript_118195/m.205290 type:complete len:340 (-) Transcript_118195:95-1114(-)
MSRERPRPDQRGPMVENKIFVGGLSQTTTNESLNRHFQQYGQADAIVMMDKTTGRSRGFGFCTFATPEASQKALAAPQVVDGKNVECMNCWAKPAGRSESKIFVGALAQTTSTESLNEHFRQYGPCDGIVMMDKVTGRSRGFGFVTFSNPESLQGVLSTQQVVDGKVVDCKVCSPKGEVVMPYKPNRIFVGGLPQSADENKLRDFFSLFGAISDLRIMTDKDSGRSRGFGYVTFQSSQACELALAHRANNVIDDKWVEVKRCTERSAMPKGAVNQAFAHLTPHQLGQVANLAGQLQALLGQPLMQALQKQMGSALPGGKGGGKGGLKGDKGAQQVIATN